MEGRQPQEIIGLGNLRTRLPQSQQGRASPHEVCPKVSRRKEGRMGRQSPRDTGRRRRRDGSPQSPGRGGRQKREGRSRQGEGQEREEEEFDQLRDREAQEKEEKEKEEKGKDKGQRDEAFGKRLRGDGAGPQEFREERVKEEGEEVSGEERRGERIRELLELRDIRGEGRSGRRPGRLVRGGNPGEKGVESIPWSSDFEHSGADAGHGGQHERPALGFRQWECTSHLLPVLEDGPSAEDVGAVVKGDPDDCLRAGLDDPGQNFSSRRCPDTAPEELGADLLGWALHGDSEAGACAVGGHEFVFTHGSPGCLQTPEGGEQSQSCGVRQLEEAGLGKERGAQAERKRERQREEQEQRRKREEPEGRRETKGELRKTLEEFEKERKSRDEAEIEQRAQEEKGSSLGSSQGAPSEGCSSEQPRVGQPVLKPLPATHVSPWKGQSFCGVAEKVLMMFKETLEDFKPLHGKTKTSGSIFPLPETFVVIQQALGPHFQQHTGIVQMICSGLNSYYGVKGLDRPTLPAVAVTALKGLCSYADDVSRWSEKFEGIAWEDYLNVKSVDYQGEEVKVAKPFGWRNIEPALPDGIGSIPLEEVCELGTREFVLSFEDYLVPEEERLYTRAPRVMVDPTEWEQICSGLLSKGVCSLLPLREVCKVQNKSVLNGMFGVSKNKFTDQGTEVMRLIMNLVPTNKLCRGLGGDITTLPSWAGMSPYILDDQEVVVMSSEDVRCFFYLFSIPKCWWPYMCFAREVPSSLWPEGGQGPYVLCSRVLPMGFLNSVSIAQHVHRRIARLALHTPTLGVGPQDEIRKDLPFSVSKKLYRVYLNNFDLLQRLDSELAKAVEGQVAPEAAALRNTYLEVGLPRHPKKSVEQRTFAEIQGALVDGVRGFVKPKPQKVMKYVELALLLLEKGDSTQRQMQIICGGFVYCCMFRRALLGCLNAVWQFIVSFSGDPPFIRRSIPMRVRSEILRFICLVPLSQMNLRAPMKGAVTASDASEYGGGFCISRGLTPMGCHAMECNVRGEVFDIEDHVQVLTIGLFDGIGALRVSADVLALPMAGHVSSEVNKEGTRVIETHFPDSVAVGNVEDISEEMVLQWSLRYSNVGIVLVGGGPPCQGVSGLNADRKGSLRDARSKLFSHVPRVVELRRKYFKWAQVHHIMESVFSMDVEDRVVMSKAIGCQPWMLNSEGISLCRRPRLYWISWELVEGKGVIVKPPQTAAWEEYGEIHLSGEIDAKAFISSGWKMNCPILPTFTTSRPRDSPGNRPAGLWQCEEHELTRWREDKHRFPPYVYRDVHCLSNEQGELRLPSIQEKEVMMGFPVDFTASCVSKQHQKGEAFSDSRLTLIGNSWHVPTVTWLLSQLFFPLGLTQVSSVDEVISLCTPGTSRNLATYLRRPPLKQQRHSTVPGNELQLAKKLVNFVSVKGEDLLLQATTENAVKFHRLRTSVPSRLWRWRVVCGWPWKHQGFHINALELQATLSTLQWRLERRKDLKRRFVHLTDSLVTLHALTRGRSSSRKLRAILSKINALMLAGDVRPIMGVCLNQTKSG